MRAITIMQPWTRAVVIGRKPVENRSRYTSHVGLLAVHAGRRIDQHGKRDPLIVDLFGPEPALGEPLGAVIGVVTLVGCHRATSQGGVSCCSPWGRRFYTTSRGEVGAWHLVFRDARMLAEPVPARGQLAVPWVLPPEVAEQVNAQLGGGQGVGRG